MEGQSWYGSWDRTTETGKPEQINLDQLGQLSLGRTERTSQDITATLRQQRSESHGQDCWSRMAGTGQLGRNGHDRTAGTGQREKTVRTVHLGQETEYKTARTGQQGGQLGQDKGIGQP
jgi:hypothetical protein